MLDMDVHPTVQTALHDTKPVVALESTIITHGMPFPQNLEIAQNVEATVKENGATPATIAILDGRLKIGLSTNELEALAQSKDAAKLSRADLAVCLAEGKTGATTVAATMIAAHLAGIEVFATGGIGGVHRHAEKTFDISADLQELAQTPLSVIAAGPKAILDIPKTLEVLESLGVPVISYGQDHLPAFWSRSSGLRSPLRMDDVTGIARAHLMRQSLGIAGGQLIANPIPRHAEIPIEEIEPFIAQALEAALEQEISAKEVTPFLLSRLFDLTQGRSLQANKALVLNNAALGAKIAGAICAQK
ncbi:MAG: pseudouridine-5'-phosphate glycosidase [Paracoccaceae bacterium]